MFPYSDFAKGNKQSEKKFEIQFAVAPNAKELTKEGIHSFPFYFKFNETTSSQVEKQCNIYTQYWSKLHDQVLSMAHCLLAITHLKIWLIISVPLKMTYS